MTSLLRIATKPRWYPQAWLAEGDAPGDILKDFGTDSCTLSVYRIDEDGSNLSVVLAGLAAAREKLDKIDYVLVADAIIAELGIKTAVTAGETPCAAANAAHVDLVELSAQTTFRLASTAFRLTSPVRKSRTDVANIIRDAKSHGHIEHDRINERIWQEVFDDEVHGIRSRLNAATTKARSLKAAARADAVLDARTIHDLLLKTLQDNKALVTPEHRKLLEAADTSIRRLQGG